MNKAQAIKELYAEIKRACGTEISDREALELANTLVQAQFKEYEPNVNFRQGRIGFDQLGIDRVFEDGGWKVMSREYDEYCHIKEKEEREKWLDYYFRNWLSQLK